MDYFRSELGGRVHPRIGVEVLTAPSTNEDTQPLNEETPAVQSPTSAVIQVDDDVLQNAYRLVYRIARMNARMIHALFVAPVSSHQAQPISAGEIRFAIKFDAHGNPVLSGNNEGSIQIKLTWGAPSS
ncbi:MAG: hypothetical protein SF162_01320 [bacterium]|nr:hypothetical protein [bacterium]